MNINQYIREEVLDKIYNDYPNVYGVISNLEVRNNKNKCFGKIILLISIKNKKKLKLNDIIEFNYDKIKLRPGGAKDERGCRLYLIDPYWCRIYVRAPKIECPVRVLKSKVDGSDTERIYWGTNENIKMNKDQFIKRRLLLKFAKTPSFIVKACENFNDRYWSSKNYYKSLNETSKHYLIKHDQLKSYIASYNNAKKVFNKEWNDLLLNYYQNNDTQREVDVLFESFEKIEKQNNVINFSSKP